MKRELFILLIVLPFVCAFFVPLNVYLFVAASIYLIVLNITRLKYIGYNWKKILKTFILGPFSNYWWKMREKDTAQ